MKITILLMIFLFTISSAIGQDSLDKNWVLGINIGIQAHDKRLYGSPLKEELLASQPEIFGTYQFSISINNKLFQKDKIKLFGGFGVSSELSTFLRPFDHNYGKNGGGEELRLTNRYYKFLLQFPINFNYELSKHFDLLSEILPQFNILTIADHTENMSFSWWGFDYHSIELNPGLNYKMSNFIFGFKFRIFQVKKIDKIIFNSIIDDPRVDQTFETNNPFKIWFSMGYRL